MPDWQLRFPPIEAMTEELGYGFGGLVGKSDN
jgi:hypothetical protein